jgi:hypothetical protein
MPQPITVRSRWQTKSMQAEVTVTRVTFREVSYIALDKPFSGTVSQWVFLPRLPAGDRAQEEGALSRLLIARKIRISSELVKDFFSKAKIKAQIALRALNGLRCLHVRSSHVSGALATPVQRKLEHPSQFAAT